MGDSDELTEAVVASRYRLDARRRSGADSTSVFDATDLQSGATVVVRLVTAAALAGRPAGDEVDAAVEPIDDAVERFKRGVLAVAGVVHPVLVPPLDWGEVTLAGTRYVFVVTERIPDVSLRELLDRGRRLTASQAVVIAIDVCRALHHLHKAGIVHGDVRPANIFVSDRSRARLAGLGTKRIVGAAGMSIEQARYAAPEFATNPTPSAAGDVYALALSMLETLTGEVPFAADSIAVTLANRAGRLLPVSAEIGPVAAPIEKAARPEPADRSTALDFGQALVQVAAKLAPPKPIEALTSESFRDSITRTLETVVVAPPPEPARIADAPEPAPEPAPEAVEAVDVVVESPTPKRGRLQWVRTAAIVVAVAVSGVLVWQALTVPSHEVPELAGVAEGEARNQLALFNWPILVRVERSDEVELGDVIRTVPSAGTMLREGSDLTLVVSEGPRLSVLPDVTGLTREAAVAALEAQGLVPMEITQPDDTVPIGVVVSWLVPEQPDLKKGRQVLKGTQVDIIVSSGPGLVVVPDLLGLTEEEALARLSELQFPGKRGPDVTDSELDAGRVAFQSPDPGAELMRGSTIVYSVVAES